MKISIVTINYNNRLGLVDTLLSISKSTKSTDEQVEVIVIDGGSDDGSLEVINDFRHMVTKFVSEPDDGIYDAMNKGVELSSGDSIIFMNSGDRFFYDFDFDAFFKYLVENGIDLSKMTIFGDNCIKIGDAILLRKISSNDNSPCHQSMFVPRHVLLNFKFNCRYKICADYDQKIKILSNTHTLHYPYFVCINELGGVSNNWPSYRKVFQHVAELVSIDNLNVFRSVLLGINVVLKKFLIDIIGYKKFYLLLHVLKIKN